MQPWETTELRWRQIKRTPLEICGANWVTNWIPTLPEVSSRMPSIRDGAPMHLSNGRLNAFELMSYVVG